MFQLQKLVGWQPPRSFSSPLGRNPEISTTGDRCLHVRNHWILLQLTINHYRHAIMFEIFLTHVVFPFSWSRVLTYALEINKPISSQRISSPDLQIKVSLVICAHCPKRVKSISCINMPKYFCKAALIANVNFVSMCSLMLVCQLNWKQNCNHIPWNYTQLVDYCSHTIVWDTMLFSPICQRRFLACAPLSTS